MALTAEQIFNAIAPQFVSDPNKSTHLEIATLRTSQNCFGDKYNLAIALRAAHTLTLTDTANNLGGSSGGVTSKREGDLALSFGGQSSTGIKGDLGQSTYGVQLQNLIDGNILAINLTGLNIDCQGNLTLEDIYGYTY